MKILLSLILSFLFSYNSWAYLTEGYIPVVKTSSSSGVASTNQNSECQDSGTVVTCSGQLNIPQICLNGVCEVAWPSGGSQTTGSSMLAGNGAGGYTNVTVTSPSTYSGGVFTAAVSNNVNLNGHQFGTWSGVAYGFGSIYQAPTDLIICATVTANSGSIYGATNSSSSLSGAPTVAQTATGGNSSAVGMCFPVKKNDYFEVTSGGPTGGLIYDLPMGS